METDSYWAAYLGTAQADTYEVFLEKSLQETEAELAKLRERLRKCTTLTGAEIAGLAKMAGYAVSGHCEEYDEISISIFLPIETDDRGYRLYAYYSEYPEEGATPLGTTSITTQESSDASKG